MLIAYVSPVICFKRVIIEENNWWRCDRNLPVSTNKQHQLDIVAEMHVTP